MKSLSRYFYMTLVIIQGLFLLLYFSNTNILGFMSWIGDSKIKLFLPLIVFGCIKILYWVADPLSELFTIILRWVVIIGIFYGVYWLFFVV